MNTNDNNRQANNPAGARAHMRSATIAVALCVLFVVACGSDNSKELAQPSPTAIDTAGSAESGNTSDPTPTTETDAPTPTTETDVPTNTPTPQGQQTYEVKSGDTLRAIAAEFGVTVEAIVIANSLADPNLVFIGQLLLIPTEEPATTGGRIVFSSGGGGYGNGEI